MTPAEFVAAALALGLVAVQCESSTDRKGSGRRGVPFWMLSCGGRELGSYCPNTGSARVGKVLVRVAGDAAALAAYAEGVR
jgi:hypothetical protein